MSSSSTDIARSLAEAAVSISAPRTLEETLDAIVHAARTSVPGFDHVGISIVSHDRIETKAATSQLVWELDDVQYTLQEGPCVDSIRKEPLMSAPHLRDDDRWPRYVPQAVERGVRSQLAYRLYVEEHTMGGLNFYSTESDTLQPGAGELGEVFAAHATIALGHAVDVDNLTTALTTRGVIGQAIGLTMARFQISSDRAMQFLVRASSTSNIKLREIAEEVVNEAERQFAVDR